jgi:hypothetical protein
MTEYAETTGGWPLPQSDPVAIRDRLLDLIITKLERRRDTRSLALRVAGVLDRLRGNEAIYPGDAELVAAAMEGPLRRLEHWTGREKIRRAKVAEMRRAKMDLDLVTRRLRAFAKEKPQAKPADWVPIFQQLWRGLLGQTKPLTQDALDEILDAKRPATAALLLVHKAYRGPDTFDVDEFRRALARVKLTPLV